MIAKRRKVLIFHFWLYLAKEDMFYVILWSFACFICNFLNSIEQIVEWVHEPIGLNKMAEEQLPGGFPVFYISKEMEMSIMI